MNKPQFIINELIEIKITVTSGSDLLMPENCSIIGGTTETNKKYKNAFKSDEYKEYFETRKSLEEVIKQISEITGEGKSETAEKGDKNSVVKTIANFDATKYKKIDSYQKWRDRIIF